MDTIIQKLKNRRLFLKRDAKLNMRLKEDYIENGIASLPCKVTGIDEVISHFSVPGYETLSPEFSEYIESSAAFLSMRPPVISCRRMGMRSLRCRSTLSQVTILSTITGL